MATTSFFPIIATEKQSYDDYMPAHEDFESPSYYNKPPSINHMGESPRGGGGGGILMDSTGKRTTNTPPIKKSRRITFYKNGDRYFGGKTLTVAPNRSLKELMTDLNRSVDLPYGVRRLYTPVNGSEVYDIDELVDGNSYVCASFEPFRPARYGDWLDKPWNANIFHPPRQDMNSSSNTQTQALPALHGGSFQNLTNNQATASVNSQAPPAQTNTTMNTMTTTTNSHNYFYPKTYVKANNIPLASNTNNNNGNGNGLVLSKRSNLPNTFAPFSISNPNSKNLNTSESWTKPRLITVIRATERPRRRISILLNRKALHSYEQFVCDISDAFGLPQWKNDKVRKLYTIRGRRVQGISDFFREDDIFIGVSGKEPLSGSMIQDILAEVYANDPLQAESIYKEWQATRAKPKPRYSSLDTATAANNGTNRDSGYGEGESSPETSKKSQNELDENGRKKKKKKRVDVDILLEMETQRQRERLKLIEEERKKKEAANAKTTTATDPKADSPKDNKASQKRVTISTHLPDINNNNKESTPVNHSTSSNSNTSATQNVDVKKQRRRPKYKKQNVSEDQNDRKNVTPSGVGVVVDDQQPSSRNQNIASKSPAPLKEKDNHAHKPDAAHKESKDHQQKENHGGGKPSQNVKPVATTNNANAKAKEDLINRMKRQISNASRVTDKYEFIKTLGDGNFAVVKQARLKNTDHEYAIKIIDKSKMKGKESMIDNEIYIMKACNHPNIVKLHEEFETKDEVYLVTDLVKGGDLFDAITQTIKFNERDASCMVQDLCEALFYLHSKNIVHRDLKPENLLVMRRKDDRISIKLADFGLAMEVKQPIYTVCGTPTYVAPEILSEIGYGLEVDMWACGVITYILLCGFPPFRSIDRNQEELFQYIQSGEFEYLMPYWEGISDSSKDLINHLLVVDIKKRWKAEDVLTHPWIVTQGNTKSAPSNYEEHRKEMLIDLRTKAKQYANEPLPTQNNNNSSS